MYFYLLILVFPQIFYRIKADDVLGCNGFIKSAIPISFSDVEVKLFTKQGSLKDHTECAPNNGYYFLPLYDKGEYILKVVPPDGWSFDPSEVYLSVDGVTDSCSQGKDINFEFKGFAVFGRVVSSGFNVGPKGITVELYPLNSEAPILHTLTSNNGDFMFTPVLPGDYKVKISHQIWKLNKTEANVKVLKDNGKVAEGGLAVVGYDVRGSVTSDNQPITGVSFVLFSKTRISVTGCDVSPLTGFSGDGLDLKDLSPVCHVSSNMKGGFIFPVLPPGDYVLVPYYKGSKSTKFDVHPKKLPFTVSHGSLTLPSSFQVKGFTVSGRVLWSPTGLPMSDAKVILNGKEVATTSEDGTYNLENMRAGNYKIKVTSAENVIFEEVDVKITSTVLPDLFPKSYSVCGHLYSTTSSGPYKLKIFSNDHLTDQIMTDENGHYCIYLSRGRYSITPSVDDKQRTEGLLFSPTSKDIEVVDKCLDNVDFSQLRSTVRGRIVCMSPCPPITINLKPKGKGPAKQAVAQSGLYEFTDVVPGDYDIYIEPGLGWCWEKETMSLSIMKEITELPNFTQSGFTATIVSSHDTKVSYWPEGHEKEKLEMNVSPGSTHICVAKYSPYIFEPIGCHTYKERKIRWVSGAIELFPMTHANAFYIESTHPIDDLKMTVRIKLKSKDQLPENSVQVPEQMFFEDTSVGIWRYKLSLQIAEGSFVTVIPAASYSIFTPQSVQLKGALDCTNITKPLFFAERGQVISGKVTTGDNRGLINVSISILDGDGTVLHTQDTAQDGSYKFPPIKAMSNYRLLAAKEGYVLTEQSMRGHFSAHKLAEIVVNVKDVNDGSPLQGVLLSLSGGKDYRRNAHTDTGGVMSFLSLSPGEYFLRPMMKEYRFHPTSKIISVDEGATVQFTLSGERVAYSGLGLVTSLNGEGEGGVVVEAVGLDKCNLYQEEATSGNNGHFRIRGLQPGCGYNVRVKVGPEVNQHISRATPENITIKVEASDVENLHLYALRPEWRTDVVVHITPERPEDLKTLRVRLSSEEAPDSTIHVIKLSDYKPSASGYSLKTIVVPFPPLPADGRSYIVRLESTLSQSTHSYTNRPVHFKANSSFKLIRLVFSPKPRLKEPELSQSSYLVLPLILLFTAIIYNKEKAWSLLTLAMQTRIPTRTSQSEDSGSDSFLESNFQKKKSKSRKT
ncbi:BOS complex subunit NOMO3 isoform X1 [Halyomorpha halys]|uniref:BOS complex subunit NOMO3 isoform X1 n=1 Tax=Halyomorpha halys TaxID=286706 RepID=UPI0006D5298E|nr:nodal modulator 3 isoform X1 [Halyomorpha halys]XP_024216614.1 nodal modulator 3 isoform X1 [Halyomorpha halys]